MQGLRPNLAALGLLACLAAAGSCAQEEYPAALWAAQHGITGMPDASVTDAGAVAEDSSVAGPRTCVQPRAQALPQRLVAMSSKATSEASVVLVSDLFQRFWDVCGACHGPAVDPPGQGSFQIVRASDFPSLMTKSVLRHVLNSVCPKAPDSSDPDDPMPPCSSPTGTTYASRSTADAVEQFAELTKAWLDMGKPSTFTPPQGMAMDGSSPDAAAADAGPMSQYTLSTHDGNAMTNIGTCIPSRSMIAIDALKSVELDSMFAGLKPKPGGTAAEAIGLPEHLSGTDLFTMDSAALAQYGVLAYQPAYPLWSDNAGKLRYVRVPRGTSIHFDKATQTFSIPPNSRFYKTFMKQVVDTDGSYRYRKIETRLIVARPDTNNPDGSASQNALFGTYKWNDSETDAVLVETPLKDGLPSSDTLFTYDIDEPLAAAILAGNPAAPDEALLEHHASRHYAIPSSQRCVQCHMGSPSQDFVLGFTPLQVNRRPMGSGGAIDPVGFDEMNQLQRFIDAGIITGIGSASDVLPLEQSQGSRTPRNDYELVAQGYILGNCAHCHNPRGFPTVQSPSLKDVFDLLPSATGGIFQFPLERYSPRIGRGLSGTTPIPYITPSLVDLPRYEPGSGRSLADIFVEPGSGPGSGSYVTSAVYAPWRSLLYRNVDAAFAYVDDLAIYPHMPFNTPGFDPRAKQIMSDWMVSIPAIRKHPEIPEYAVQTGETAILGGSAVDTSPQPYVEVTQDNPAYAGATIAAQGRLSILHTGENPALPIDPVNGIPAYSRYNDPGQTEDVVDPAVSLDPICHPIPAGNAAANGGYPLPNHPHWVNTDLSDPPGPWAPRQSNWTTVLVQQQVPPFAGGGCNAPGSAQSAYEDQVIAVGLLQSATLDQVVRTYATTPLPFGLWKKKSGCNFTSVPTAHTYSGSSEPHWMTVVKPPDDAPVFTQTPGAAVFKMICINCHGPKADSNGRMAQNLATMTGGNAAVADFRNGLFGPVGAGIGHRNMDAVYSILPDAGAPDGGPSWESISVDDRAARYLAWMGLGGTSVNIPAELLELVAVTKVLDQQRLAAGQLSANMLSQAKSLCQGLLGTTFVDDFRGAVFGPNDGLHTAYGYLDSSPTVNSRLITKNGDAELWLGLCTLDNPSPVHILTPTGIASLRVPVIQDSQENFAIDSATGTSKGLLVPASLYPANVPVGNVAGGVDASLTATNTWPWCIDDRSASADQDRWIVSKNLPVCPTAVKSYHDACNGSAPPADCFGNDAGNQWAVRGAINAGFAVFLYVQSIENKSPPPDYDQCELLH